MQPMSTTTPPQGQQPEPIAHCGSCGAPVYEIPAEGEGLPCGH